MQVKIRFVEIGRMFNEREKATIRSVIRRTAKRVGPMLALDGRVVFSVYAAEEALSESDPTFIGAEVTKRGWILVDVPPGPINRRDLKGACCHELHHLARGYYPRLDMQLTFLGAMISEGLATSFEMMQDPGRTPGYAEYELDELRQWFAIIRLNKWATNFDHRLWFFGQGGYWWLGYRIGKYIVDQVLARHPEETPITLVRRSAEELLEMSGVEL